MSLLKALMLNCPMSSPQMKRILGFESQEGWATLVREDTVEFIDDKGGKALAIEQVIGRLPRAVFGNSDGDLEVLQLTTQAGGRRLGVIVHQLIANGNAPTTGRRRLAGSSEFWIGPLPKDA